MIHIKHIQNIQNHINLEVDKYIEKYTQTQLFSRRIRKLKSNSIRKIYLCTHYITSHHVLFIITTTYYNRISLNVFISNQSINQQLIIYFKIKSLLLLLFKTTYIPKTLSDIKIVCKNLSVYLLLGITKIKSNQINKLLTPKRFYSLLKTKNKNTFKQFNVYITN